MPLDALFDFLADNPSTILMAGGVLGLLLCGLTSIEVFCNYWGWLIAIGFVLQLVWLLKT